MVGQIPTITNPGTVLSTAAYLANQGLSAVATAQGYASQIGSGVGGLIGIQVTPTFPQGPSAPALLTTTPPVVESVVWNAPATPADFTGDLDVSDLFFSDFTEAAPVLTFSDAPEFSDTIGAAPGVDTSYSLPDLVVNLPGVPDMLSISVSPFGGINMPTFSATSPTLDLVAPSVREYTPGAQYTSSLLTAVKERLEDRIRNGGTGLGQDAETAIWDRGREREARGAGEAIAELEQMESLGYAFPPGVYLSARTKIITETDYAARGHSREVMVESARLELDQVKHSLTTAVALESQLMDYTNAVEQRIFESCKYVTEAGVAIYNAGVQAFAARVDAYRATVQVYEARIRAELAKVEVYKTQIEAEKVKADVNQSIIARYRVQVDAALSSVEVFKARVQAVQVQAELERNKILVYGEEVRAYGAKVNAYSAGVEAFRARIQGEAAKQEAYGASVRAYATKVEATSKAIDSRIAVYKGKIDAYVARWDGYKSATQGEAAKAQAVQAGNTSKADIYRAEVSGAVGYNEVLTKQWQAALEQIGRAAEIGVASAKANADLAVSVRSLSIDAAKVSAQVAAQVGAAALGTVHYSGSYSESRSDGTSNSYSGSESESKSNSIATSTSSSSNTNYNYSA